MSTAMISLIRSKTCSSSAALQRSSKQQTRFTKSFSLQFVPTCRNCFWHEPTRCLSGSVDHWPPTKRTLWSPSPTRAPIIDLQLEEIPASQLLWASSARVFAKCPKLEVTISSFSIIEEEERQDLLALNAEFKDAWNWLPNLKFLYLFGEWEIRRELIKEMILSSENNLAIRIKGSLCVQASTTSHEIAQLPLRFEEAFLSLEEIITV